MRIAIGGFQHETNTFAPSKATFDDFARGSGWPPLLIGDQIFDGVKGMNLPITGFIDEMAKSSHKLVPIAWAAASPSAHVTEDAYEKIAKLIVDGIREAKPDCVYLDLHGAMVAENADDGEGELLRRIRNVIGERIPLVASLDLHSNTTKQMLDLADALIAYRTYPHVDMAITGARAARFMSQRIAGMPRPTYVSRQMPFLIPINAQCTFMQPAKGVYEELDALEKREGNNVPSMSFTPGFPAADFHDCGAVVWAYGKDRAAAQRACDTLSRMVEDNESHWEMEILSPDAAVKRAMKTAATARKPVVIADTQDNPGAGGNSDTMGMLHALLANRAQNVAMGLIVDRDAALAAHAAGPGSILNIELGAKSGIAGDTPVMGPFKVERISEGKLTGTGPFYGGAHMRLGPCALLSIGGVRIVVSSEKVQLADQEMYRFIGVEPTAARILVNKSSVHFRADFTPIAEEIIVAKAPGPMAADPSDLPWTKLRRGVRLKPNGPVF